MNIDRCKPHYNLDKLYERYQYVFKDNQNEQAELPRQQNEPSHSLMRATASNDNNMLDDETILNKEFIDKTLTKMNVPEEIINDEMVYNSKYDKPVGAELSTHELNYFNYPLKIVNESDKDSLEKFERNKKALDEALAKQNEGVTRYGRRTKPVDRFT